MPSSSKRTTRSRTHRCLHLLLLVTLTATLSACSTTPRQRAITTPNPGGTVTCKASAEEASCWIQVTPISKAWTGFEDPNPNFSNAYTRLLINSRHTRSRGAGAAAAGQAQANAPPLESYEYLDRNWWQRLLWGTHYTINLTAYVVVGAFEATVPLITITHTSNRADGERFSRMVVHTAQKFPLFLIRGDGSNSIANVRFIVKASDETQSQAAAAAIQAAQAVAKALAPEVSVLTTLSAERTRDKASALDRAINNVLSKQLSEEQWFENDVRRWGRGVQLTLKIPPPEQEKHWRDSSLFVPVGAWRLQFERPRPSIFSDVEICTAVVEDPAEANQVTGGEAFCKPDYHSAALAAQQATSGRAQQVLAFNLTAGDQSVGAVSSYLRQQAWWEESLRVFAALGQQEPNDADVNGFCQSIKQTIAGLGLNSVDAGIVVAAVREAVPLPATITAKMASSAFCGYAVDAR